MHTSEEWCAYVISLSWCMVRSFGLVCMCFQAKIWAWLVILPSMFGNMGKLLRHSNSLKAALLLPRDHDGTRRSCSSQ